MFRPPSSNLRWKQKCAESIRIGLMCLRTNWDWLMIFFIHQIRDRRCSQLSYKTNKLEATRTDQQTWSHNQIWRHCISFAYKISWSLQISYATSEHVTRWSLPILRGLDKLGKKYTICRKIISGYSRSFFKCDFWNQREISRWHRCSEKNWNMFFEMKKISQNIIFWKILKILKNLKIL